MKKYAKFLIVFLACVLFIPSGMAAAQDAPVERLIKISTLQGNMVIKLYNETPIHRDNFIKLVEDDFYDGQLFHRVIKDFMVQGGDPHSVGAEKGQRLGNGGPGYTLPAELSPALFHKKGALAAARQGDQVNPQKESSGSQFYLVQGKVYTPQEIEFFKQSGRAVFTRESLEAYTSVGGTPHLDGSYTVFGEIVEGMDVLDRISATPCDSYDRPLENVVYSISIVR